MKRIIKIAIMCIALGLFTTTANARTFTDKQQEIVDLIVEISIDLYEEYGILPSVAVAQAFDESTMGEKCVKNNLYGITGGAYDTHEASILAYMDLLQSERYAGARHIEEPRAQIDAILSAGYCNDEGYADDVEWTIREYDLQKYDNIIFEGRKITMEMSKTELKSKYMQDMTTEAQKKEKLQIIADLNGITVKEARQALIDAGVPEDCLPKKEGKKVSDASIFEIMQELAKLSPLQLSAIFPKCTTVGDVLKNYEAREIKAKYTHYTKEKIIVVGDIVKHKDRPALVTNITSGQGWLMYEDGRSEVVELAKCIKIGKKYNFDKILRLIGGRA